MTEAESARGAYAGGSGGSTSSPSRCPSAVPGGDAPGNPRPGNTAESGGDPASPRCRRPARASSNETEFECTSDAPLLPVCPREWLRAERLDAPAEPDGLRDE